MNYFFHEDLDKRVLLAGTYNAHPIPTAAALATMEVLSENDGAVYKHCEALGVLMEKGLKQIYESAGIVATVVRQGSAFVTYFMNHAPRDWHDLASNHNYSLDVKFRRALLEHGIFFFPLPTKQCSISAAHTKEDIDQTLDAVSKVLPGVLAN